MASASAAQLAGRGQSGPIRQWKPSPTCATMGRGSGLVSPPKPSRRWRAELPDLTNRPSHRLHAVSPARPHIVGSPWMTPRNLPLMPRSLTLSGLARVSMPRVVGLKSGGHPEQVGCTDPRAPISVWLSSHPCGSNEDPRPIRMPSRLLTTLESNVKQQWLLSRKATWEESGDSATKP